MYPYANKDSEGFTALRKHDEYYLSGGDLFFLIEQYHFRVHRYFFERESNYFKARLATPASPGASRQGTSESTAIVLDDIKADDFAKLLWVFYNPKYSLYKAKVDDWVAILDLSYRWGFQEVKSLVVREIEKLAMPVIDRVVAYHTYEIDRHLLLPCYAALVGRASPLTLEEGNRLGMETTIRVFKAREVARAPVSPSGTRIPPPIDVEPTEIKSIVRDFFELADDSPTTEHPRNGDSIPDVKQEAKKEVEKDSDDKKKRNGKKEDVQNGFANGHANGFANGHANGHANGASSNVTTGVNASEPTMDTNGSDPLKIEPTATANGNATTADPINTTATTETPASATKFFGSLFGADSTTPTTPTTPRDELKGTPLADDLKGENQRSATPVGKGSKKKAANGKWGN